MNGVHHLVLGTPDHGVTRLALQLLRPQDDRTLHPALRGPGDLDALLEALPSPDDAPVVHAHLTDGLLGPEPEADVAAVALGRRLAVTLHDVPQYREGLERHARRLELYRRLQERADLVIVSSHHERLALGPDRRARPTAVLPLPIDARQVRAAPEAEATVGVLGWIYPGKGHARVLQALATLPAPTTLVAIGAVASGHAGLDRTLAALAADLGVGFRTTGYLDDRAMLEAAARVRVPVCAHLHISASGTVGSWLAAGRRPVVADGGYAEELLRRTPGSLDVTDDLGPAIAERLLDPSPTVLGDDLVVGPSTPQAAEAQARVLARWAASEPTEATDPLEAR
ncbi:MAG: glycosyltransferase [Solirubrobacteraceae bacterium]|nr:glycosyltransferase [Solirubrobacteraceae bacterium]